MRDQGTLGIDFQRVYNADETWIQYIGTFLYDRDILTGTFEREIAKGSFLFKKGPVPHDSMLATSGCCTQHQAAVAFCVRRGRRRY
jgi:hypothetical protein